MYFLSRYRRGIFNRYRKQMPASEMLLKDLNHLLLRLRLYLANDFHHKSLLVYPHYPSRGSTIYKVAQRLGYVVTNRPDPKVDLAVYWEYLTFREEYQVLEALADTHRVVNLYSRDISKLAVDAAFAAIFGYATQVDPLTYEGLLVRKNDINAKHDGTILRGPLDAAEAGYIYQLLIDNTVPIEDTDLVVDIRVPVVGTLLDFVYLKYRPINERFLNTTVRTELTPTASVFSAEEIAQLNAFCAHIQLEYGELDVLRHTPDQRIYVVDVNNTPQGPPAHTTAQDQKEALGQIAAAFEAQFRQSESP
jgi:hypothetical protein